MRRRWAPVALWLGLCAVGALALSACSRPTEERAAANAALLSAKLGEGLTVQVEGASLMSSRKFRSGRTAQVKLRAQSLDVRVDLIDRGCAPHTVELTISHLPRTQIDTSVRPLLDARSLELEIAEEALGGLFDLRADPHDAQRVPLDLERPFETSPGREPGQHVVWVTLDRGRRTVRVAATPPEEAPPAPGACVAFDTEAAGALGQASLVARLRFRRVLSPKSVLRFGVLGNVAGELKTLDTLIESINERAPDFLVVNGDLTAAGAPAQLSAVIDRLDRGLDLPWFATVGDRDVSGDLQKDLVGYLGRTHFAFDAGPLRLMVLDSADASLSLSGHDDLYRWLRREPLWWGGDPVPTNWVAVTHVPPFDPLGTRGMGFHQRLEAGRLLSAMRRAKVSWLITSHVPEYSVHEMAGISVLFAGGGGAPLSVEGARHFWVEAVVSGDCVGRGAAVDLQDGCGGCGPTSRCIAEVGQCGPCMSVQPIYVPAEAAQR